MNIRFYRFFILVMAAVITAAVSCSFPDGPEVPFSAPFPDKNPPENHTTVVRVALYVDTDNQNYRDILREAGNYYVELPDAHGRVSRVPYFDFVVVGGAKIRQGDFSAYIDISDPLWDVINNRRSVLRPLQDKGIRVLLGIEGGNDGITFASLANEAGQIAFARQCVAMQTFYDFNGVEFYDRNGDDPNTTRNPYPPEEGSLGGGSAVYWDGQQNVTINTEAELKRAWEKGGGQMVDMMSYIIELLGAYTSFQGDTGLEQVDMTPIIVREVGFSRYLPPNVPRFDFQTTLSCVRFGINNDPGIFGSGNGGASYNGFLWGRAYAPLNIDLSNVSANLQEFSERFGRSDLGTPDELQGNSQYGLLYYTNMQRFLDDPGVLDTLSVTSQETFGTQVIFSK